ncbi:MAG: P-II family nitrogen regulator [bacterium]
MKRVEAIVRPERMGAVKCALEGIGYSGLMITAVEGHGKQKGVEQTWRGEKYKVEFIPKTKIDLVVRDADVGKVVRAVTTSARTGEVGDGKIFVSPVENAIRIRTGEEGEEAV